MQLIGMLDSPYVRRVAISLKLMRLPFEHRALSVFRNFDEFSRINPMVKAPTLVAGNGTVLMDSTLILDYLEHEAGPARSLMPADLGARLHALQLLGIALVAADKAVQMHYEHSQRPPEKTHQPWLDRVAGQLTEAFRALEPHAERAQPWLQGSRMLQPDVTVAVAWRFTHFILPGLIDAAAFPALGRLSQRAEALPEFAGTPLE